MLQHVWTAKIQRTARELVVSKSVVNELHALEKERDILGGTVKNLEKSVFEETV
jgi:hypothetical protein